MTTSIVKKKIEQKEAVYCLKACYADPELVEFLGKTGVDCIWICLEHRKLDVSLIDAIIRSCRLAGVDALFRVKPGAHSDLLYLLENGVKGIMIPQVRDPGEIETVVQAMKFQPIGQRGLDPIHADTDFGRLAGEEYMRIANENTFLAVQVETEEIVAHLDTIAAMPGVDILFLGLGDLSANLGVPGQLDHPKVQAVVSETISACKVHGKACGIVCGPEQVVEYHEQGIQFFNIGSDFRYMRAGVAQTREALSGIQIGQARDASGD